LWDKTPKSLSLSKKLRKKALGVNGNPLLTQLLKEKFYQKGGK